MTDRSPTDRSISVLPNGPYVVAGEVGLVRRRPVTSEHGEPMTWQTTEQLPTPARTLLCRCGRSGQKPFCDGAHARAGADSTGVFDGTETAHTTDYDERQRTYPATRIVMRDDRSICVHAGFCGNRLTNVWKMAGDDSTEDSITRAQLMAMIEHCPSGALTYRIESDDPDIEPDLPVEIAVVDDGPLWVTGYLPVVQANGTKLEARNRVTLCRCGQSSNKPYCDGAHRDAAFKDPS